MSSENRDRGNETTVGEADFEASPFSRVTVYSQSDSEETAQMLVRCGAEERIRLLPKPEGEGNLERKAFVFRENSIICGVALLWQNAFHPFGRYLEIHSLPEKQEMRMAEKLIEAVLAEAGEKAIQVMFRKPDFLAADFYVRFGFAEMRKTYMPKLELAKIEQAAEARSEEDGEARVQIRSFAELRENEAALDSLAELMRLVYTKAHEDNPPANHPLSVWRTFVEADDLLEKGSFAAFTIEDGEALAFAVLHEGETAHEAELGWLGAKSGFDTLMQAVDRKRMDYCFAQRLYRLSAEIDTTDPYQLPLLEKYPFESSEPLLTYRREADGVQQEAGAERK